MSAQQFYVLLEDVHDGTELWCGVDYIPHVREGEHLVAKRDEGGAYVPLRNGDKLYLKTLAIDRISGMRVRPLVKGFYPDPPYLPEGCI